MTKASITGIVAAVVVVISAFLPWADVLQLHFTGLDTTGSAFGQPGKVNVFMAVVAGVLFALNKGWTFRVNLFISGFLMAWVFRNYLLFSRCEAGVCPDAKVGLYLSLIAGITCFVCVLASPRKLSVPKVEE